MFSSSKQSKASKEGHQKFSAKANPTMKYQEDAAKELWKSVKDDPEQQKQMML